jgi:hypothetical protein
MALTLLSLAFYLWALGKWGKYLKGKDTPLGRKRLYGALSAIPMLVASIYYGYDAFNSGSFDIGAFVFMLVWNAAAVTLGFIAVVYAPKWIVGAPKSVRKSGAK